MKGIFVAGTYGNSMVNKSCSVLFLTDIDSNVGVYMLTTVTVQ